jgi:S-layer homology domain
MRTPLSSCLKVAALFLGIAVSTRAEQPSISGGVVLSALRAPLGPPRSEAIPGPSFGTSSTSQVTLGACLATTRSNLPGFVPAEITNCERVVPFGNGLVSIAFPVALPSGALVLSITLDYWDSDTTSDPSLGFLRTSPSAGLESLADLNPPVFAGGANSVTWQIVPPVQIDNTYAHQLMAVLKQTSDTEYSGITRFAVNYQLQVSPAPGNAMFTDVATDHVFFQYIEALAASGITGGCGGGNYCPDQPLTRGQMAVFLSKALGLHFPN